MWNYRNCLSRIACCFLAVLLFVSCGFAAMGASVFNRPQKHIYLVLDDSSSMLNGRDQDANYALQTMIAMTDKTDTIDIYFLNQTTPIDGAVDLKKKSNDLLANIKEHYPASNGSTPFAVVGKAVQDMRGSVSKDDDGEYWLVIITDGGFNESNTEKSIVEYANAKLMNGDLPRVMCVGIGGSALYFGNEDENLRKNIVEISAPDAITAMNEAAKLISDRVEITQKDCLQGDKTLRFSIPYPAKNVIVFTQNALTKIENYQCASKLDVSENYTVSHPAPTKELADSTVCFITGEGSKVISAGEMSLTFSSPLKVSNTVVLVEPAIGMVAHYYNGDGQECDPAQLRVNEKVRVEYTICNSDTMKPIDEKAIDGGVTYSAEIDGKSYNSNIIDFTVTNEELPITLNVTFPDGFVLSSSEVYSGLSALRELTLLLPEGGAFSADINTLRDVPGVKAVPRINGQPLTKEELSSCRVFFRGTNLFTGRFDVKKNDDTADFTIFPKGGFLKLFTPKEADVTVTIQLKTGETASESLHVELTGERGWIGFVIAVIVTAIAVYLIVIYSIKRKFPLDLVLCVYSFKMSDTKKPLLKTPRRKRSIWHPGVIDFVSALPHPGPFIIRLGKVCSEYDGITLIADVNGHAFVEGVPANVSSSGTPNPMCLVYQQYGHDKKINPINPRGYLNQQRTGGKKKQIRKDCLRLGDGEMIVPVGNTRFNNKAIRYVRKSTKRKNNE